jgi:type IV secretion system protein VirB2
MDEMTPELQPAQAANVVVDRVDRALSITAHALIMSLVLVPGIADAASLSGSPFGGLTPLLKTVANQLIYEWGYYIGIITLGIQGYRFKTGRIDLMTLGAWGFGIGMVFFAPNIVGRIRAASGGSIA